MLFPGLRREEIELYVDLDSHFLYTRKFCVYFDEFINIIPNDYGDIYFLRSVNHSCIVTMLKCGAESSGSNCESKIFRKTLQQQKT